VLLEIKARDN